MFSPTVTEQRLELEPVVHDPFIDDLAPRPLAPDPGPDTRARRRIVD